jgi:signal transduction histidine kinase
MTPKKPARRSARVDRTPVALRAVEHDDRDVVRALHARVHELETEREALEDFVALAAHELSAPLALTEAYSGLIADSLRPEQTAARQDVETVRQTAGHARRLVDTLLRDARSRACGVARDHVDMDPLVGDCLRTLRPEIEELQAAITVDPLPIVLGEAVLLKSVVMNLLVNALRYSRRDAPNIRVWSSPEEQGMCRLGVDSEGPPIPLGDARRILEPYTRGRGERRADGSGLGLAICRRTVERHGGRIGVEPLATANRVWFTLPVG